MYGKLEKLFPHPEVSFYVILYKSFLNFNSLKLWFSCLGNVANQINKDKPKHIKPYKDIVGKAK